MTITAKVQRTTNGRWKKGASPNPAGRKKQPDEIRDLFLDGSPKAARRIIELIDDPDGRIALQASSLVLDRAYGKPKQAESGTSVDRLTAFVDLIRGTTVPDEDP